MGAGFPFFLFFIAQTQCRAACGFVRKRVLREFPIFTAIENCPHPGCPAALPRGRFRRRKRRGIDLDESAARTSCFIQA
jgi:hypothetical protein